MTQDRTFYELDVDILSRALHGSGCDDLEGPTDLWGSCCNWAPGWGAECGPDKHRDEARQLLVRIEAARKGTFG